MATKEIRAELTAKLRLYGHHFREMFGRESLFLLHDNRRNPSSINRNELSGIDVMASARANRYSGEVYAKANGLEGCYSNAIDIGLPDNRKPVADCEANTEGAKANARRCESLRGNTAITHVLAESI